MLHVPFLPSGDADHDVCILMETHAYLMMHPRNEYAQAGLVCGYMPELLTQQWLLLPRATCSMPEPTSPPWFCPPWPYPGSLCPAV